MLSFTTILEATAPVFIIIGLGFLFQRRSWTSEAVELGLMRLALNLLLPCFILSVIPGNPGLAKVSSAIWAVGVGFASVICGFAVSSGVGWVMRLRRGQGLRTFTLSSGIQNYGYLAIPVVIELFSEQSGPMGLIFVHGLGVELAMWSIGLMILTGRAAWRSLITGPFISVLLALTLNYIGIQLPKPVAVAIGNLGQCAIPLSIFMIGATMGRFCQRDVLVDAWRVSFASILARMALIPAMILAMAWLLPLPMDLRLLLVIQSAMPAAVFPIVLARLYGGSPAVAIQVVLATSLVSVVSSPIVIAFGLNWTYHFFLLPPS